MGTAFYGIREYQNGAWLRGHVDRIDTHVVSATLTLQTEEGVETPDWPLEVVNIDGTRSAIQTEPGSMILYESAKVIHGRPKIFNGTYHYGAFAHFRPVNWEKGTWLDFSDRASKEIRKNMGRCTTSIGARLKGRPRK